MADGISTIMTLRAILTMDTKDFDSNVSKSQSSAKKFASALGKTIKGAAVAATAAIGAAATGIANLTKAAVSSYADYEQLVGGVETLFDNTENLQRFKESLADVGYTAEEIEAELANYKDPIEVVMENAANAYKTAGLSANEYMETVTGMAAALNQSTGDLAVSADYANMAITDMADNANKMGSSMESIQTAYAGFSKQNYTMLDNLKLGYGGTKEEMERLLKDAQEFSGVEYDISSYADIVEAIHVVQTEMGITGTTAAEASKTISGSVGAMKASWTNFMTALANPDADIGAMSEQLVASIVTVKDNIMPVIQQVLASIAEAIPIIVPMIAEMLPVVINELLPGLLDMAVQIINILLNSFMENLPIIVTAIVDMVDLLANTLIDNMPIILSAIITVIGAIIERLPEILSAVWEAFVQILDSWGILDFFEGIWNGIVEVFSVVVDWFKNLWEDIKEIFRVVADWLDENVIQPILTFLQPLFDFISTAVNNVVAIFRGCWLIIKQIWSVVAPWFDEHIIQPIAGFFSGMWDGIKSAASDAWEGIKAVFQPVVDWFKNVFHDAWEGVKNVFSTGGKIFDGIKEGIENTFKTVVNAIIRGINTVIAIPFNAINDFLWVLRNVNILGLHPFDWISLFGVPRIPELAQGGVLKRGQVGVLEGNGAEAVVPLEKNREWIHAVAQDFGREMGGATTVTINVYGAQGQDVNELAEIISRKINDAVVRDRRVFA